MSHRPAGRYPGMGLPRGFPRWIRERWPHAFSRPRSPPGGDRCPPGRIRSRWPGPERMPVRARHTGPHRCMSRRGWNALRGRCRYGSHTRSAARGCRQGPHPVRLSGLPAPEYPAVRRASVSFSAAPAGPSGRIPAALPPAPARSLPFPAIRRRGAGTEAASTVRPPAGPWPYKVPHLYIIPFPSPLSGGVADLDGPVQPPGAPPDLFRPRRRPPRVRMRADGAPRVDDGCPDVRRLTVRRPHHVPVARGSGMVWSGSMSPSGKAPVAGVSGRSRAGAVRSGTRAAVTASKAGRFFRSPAAPDPPALIRVPDPACGTGSPSSSAHRTGPARWRRTRRRPPLRRALRGRERPVRGSSPSSGGPVPVLTKFHTYIVSARKPPGCGFFAVNNGIRLAGNHRIWR